MNQKVIINKNIWILIISLIAILAIVIRYTLFTDKFFGISIGLLSWLKAGAPSYNTVYDSEGYAGLTLFYYIDFFNMETLIEWSIYISIIFIFVNIFLLKNIKLIALNKFLIILTSIMLWDLFAAGLTKEVIQTVFYLIIYYIITNKLIKKTGTKVILSSIVLYISSIYFRPYYILVAFFSIVVYGINSYLRRKTLKPVLYYIYSLILYLICIGIFLQIVSLTMPIEYSMITELRNSTGRLLLGENTDSFIDNVFIGNGLLVYMLNYFIIYLRLLFPIELLVGGKLYYIPFIIYQLSFSYFYIKNICRLKKLNDIKFVSLIFITSFILVSVMFEPDFGSWVRHQSACYMLLIILLR